GESLLDTLGKLWLAGVQVNWSKFYAQEKRSRRPLPTYPFERQRYWIDPPRQDLDTKWREDPAQSLKQSDQADLPVVLTGSLHPRLNHFKPYVAPRNEIEQSIAIAWQQVLGIEHISIYDNFFEIGGHSLSITQVISRLQTAFPIKLPLRSLFEAPTIAMLAEIVEELLIQKIEELSGGMIQQIL
ncbi:MAG TPA: phosphopantetheine-binding protein, partial [Ktedonobacteraceae bacterium]|nr:phosphopantetheine-binding protein [Ktedonobacteraceae bacterium]